MVNEMIRKASLVLAFFVLLSSSASAADRISQALFSDLAVNGYDPVSYFTDAMPEKGRKRFSYQWNGATWRFATAEHKQMFMKNPYAYAPQYGGYCAFGVAQNKLSSASPLAWKIVDKKLYLNYDQDIHQVWLMDVQANINKANQNWPAIIQ